MAAPVIYGPAYSTYTRTARMALIEKGAAYRLEAVDMFKGEHVAGAHASRHPFGKVPTLEHDGFVLYETSAIARYIDRVFPGPSLHPSDPRHCARMDQIISIIDSYAYGAIIGQLAWQRLVVPMTGGAPDEGVIQASLPRVQLSLSEFDRLADGGQFLAGPSLSLADIYLGPVMWYLAGTPEAASLMAGKPKLAAWWSSFSARPSMAESEPKFG
jgi:glutathione S-transferase